MFLEELSRLAAQMKLPPPMYQLTPIRYEIHLDIDGKYLGIIEFEDGKNKSSLLLEAPYCKRSSGIKPKLLVDNGEYTLGIGREKSDPRRVQEQHAAYVALIQDCATITHERSVLSVAQFLQELDVTLIRRDKPDFDSAGNIIFKVDSIYPFKLDSVKHYWAKKATAASDTEKTMQCLVCGELRPPVERLPIVIKGIPGGQATGLTLISANAAAFESYGLTASLIAPTCEACGERFGNALNKLLQERETHIVLPPLAYIFWVRDANVAEMKIPSKLMEPESAEIGEMLKSPKRGKDDLTYIDATVFYAATLSASGARVVLRDWIETSPKEVQNNLKWYFSFQQILDTEGGMRHFSLASLINATINRDSQEKPSAQVGQALMHLALYGDRLPSSLSYKVVRRIRATRKIQPAQAALIKMVILSRGERSTSEYEENYDMTTIQDDCTDIAYLCGRLLAQLDYIQYRALGKVNATIVDRFYGTASTSPVTVFPRLIQNSRHHLTTIRQKRNKQNSCYLDYLDEDLSKLLDCLPPKALPRMLSLDQQSMFALGFYHQRTKYIIQGQNSKPEDADSNDTNNNDIDDVKEQDNDI